MSVVDVGQLIQLSMKILNNYFASAISSASNVSCHQGFHCLTCYPYIYLCLHLNLRADEFRYMMRNIQVLVY